MRFPTEPDGTPHIRAHNAQTFEVSEPMADASKHWRFYRTSRKAMCIIEMQHNFEAENRHILR
jgi:hypothetical protein